MIVDTLRFSKLLHEKGHFSVEQANTLAETIGMITTEGLATKIDIAELRTEIAALRTDLKGEIADLRVEMKGEIADLRMEMKGDGADLRMELKGDGADPRMELKADIAALRGEMYGIKSDLMKGILGAMGLQTVLVIGSLFAFVRMIAK